MRLSRNALAMVAVAAIGLYLLNPLVGALVILAAFPIAVLAWVARR